MQDIIPYYLGTSPRRSSQTISLHCSGTSKHLLVGMYLTTQITQGFGEYPGRHATNESGLGKNASLSFKRTRQSFLCLTGRLAAVAWHWISRSKTCKQTCIEEIEVTSRVGTFASLPYSCSRFAEITISNLAYFRVLALKWNFGRKRRCCSEEVFIDLCQQEQAIRACFELCQIAA